MKWLLKNKYGIVYNKLELFFVMSGFWLAIIGALCLIYIGVIDPAHDIISAYDCVMLSLVGFVTWLVGFSLAMQDRLIILTRPDDKA